MNILIMKYINIICRKKLNVYHISRGAFSFKFSPKRAVAPLATSPVGPRPDLDVI